MAKRKVNHDPYEDNEMDGECESQRIRRGSDLDVERQGRRLYLRLYRRRVGRCTAINQT